MFTFQSTFFKLCLNDFSIFLGWTSTKTCSRTQQKDSAGCESGTSNSLIHSLNAIPSEHCAPLSSCIILTTLFFSCKMAIFSLLFQENICCRYSMEAQQMLFWKYMMCMYLKRTNKSTVGYVHLTASYLF